jgi:hypothetical protein
MKKPAIRSAASIISMLFALAILVPSVSLFGQTDDFRPLFKLGGYPIFRNSKLNGYILSFELERVFKRNMSFTYGPRTDYYEAGGYFDYPTYFSGVKYLSLGYQLKVYPFHFIYDKSYQGPYIGTFATYLAPIDWRYKNGPGIATPVGYQYVFKKKISLGAEATMVYFKNVNLKAIDRSNPEERYFFFLLSIKLGMKFNFKEPKGEKS